MAYGRCRQFENDVALSLLFADVQLGVGEKYPCSFEPLVVEAVSGLGIRNVSAPPDGRVVYAISCTG